MADTPDTQPAQQAIDRILADSPRQDGAAVIVAPDLIELAGAFSAVELMAIAEVLHAAASE